MRFLGKIFGSKKIQLNNNLRDISNVKQNVSQDENVSRLLELKVLIDSLINSRRYVAKSDYLKQMKEYVSVINFFDVLEKSGMLNEFGLRNDLSMAEIKQERNRAIYEAINRGEKANDLAQQYGVRLPLILTIKKKDYSKYLIC